MQLDELPILFDCEGTQLVGILHPVSAAAAIGVLIIVGGPQYRVGSHRQFVLLARYLAEHDIPILRFDYRGMGDSGGESVTFESCDADIKAAVDAFIGRQPTIKKIVIWGLCDAASAALLYAYQDPRICGLVLLNPWVRTEVGLAKTYLRHYYSAHVFDRDLWRRIMTGQFSYRRAMRALVDNLRLALRRGGGQDAVAAPFPVRMRLGLQRFEGRVLLILSGDDLTAAEFVDLTNASHEWQQLLSAPRIVQRRLKSANHTFASREWRNEVADWTLMWIKSV